VREKCVQKFVKEDAKEASTKFVTKNSVKKANNYQLYLK
jgi:hypothetical protein